MDEKEVDFIADLGPVHMMPKLIAAHLIMMGALAVCTISLPPNQMVNVDIVLIIAALIIDLISTGFLGMLYFRDTGRPRSELFLFLVYGAAVITGGLAVVGFLLLRRTPGNQPPLDPELGAAIIGYAIVMMASVPAMKALLFARLYTLPKVKHGPRTTATRGRTD